MNILFLTQVVPYPLDAGPKVRAYYVLRHLVEAGHEVTLATFTRPSDGEAALAEPRRLCARVVEVPMPRSRLRDLAAYARSLADGRPFLIARDDVAEMHAALAAVVRQRPPDVIHADQLWMAPYALAAAAATPGQRPATVLDQHNAVFQVPERLASSSRNPLKRGLLNVEARRMARYEMQACRLFDRVVWVTDEDRAAFEALRPAGGAPDSPPPMPPFTTIPICVDAAAAHLVQRVPHPRRVTFVGGMHWPPNADGITWFARHVWPTVQDAVLDARLTVIGKSPPSQLQRLRRDGARIDVAGFVEDPRHLFAATAAFLVPLQAGGGMRVKIVDAWSWGLPVVTTSIGGEGTAVVDGENALLADTAEGFASAVIRLLRDPDLARQLVAAGRDTVAARYDWRRVYGAWDGVYEALAGGRRP